MVFGESHVNTVIRPVITTPYRVAANGVPAASYSKTMLNAIWNETIVSKFKTFLLTILL